MTAIPLRVLLLEDSLDDAKLVIHALSRAGFSASVTTVQTRERFLEHLKPDLDLILSDFSVPGFNGLEALRLTLERQVDVPFIFVSGTIGEEAAVGAMLEGAADYLMKDRLARLGPAIKQVLARSRLKEEKLASDRITVRLAGIVESSSDAIMTQSLDGTITSWNAAATRLYGYSANEILGKNVSVLFPQFRRGFELPENIQDQVRRLTAGEDMPAVETIRVRKDGRRIEILQNISPLRGKNGVLIGVSASGHDVTAQRRSERFLKAVQSVTAILSESKTIEDAGPKVLQTIAVCLRWEVAALWMVDRKSNVLRRLHEWHAPYANEKFLATMDRRNMLEPGEGVAGRIWNAGETTWVRGDSDGMHCGFGLPMRRGANLVGVIEFYNPELRELDEVLVTALDNVAGQINQFLERCQSESDLRESEERNRVLIETIPHVVWMTHSDGLVAYLNQNGARYLGIPAASFNGWNWLESLHPDDRTRARESWERCVRDETLYWMEHRVRQADGSYRWNLAKGLPLRGTDGSIENWVGTWTDIDDQKRNLDALQISEDRFRKLIMTLPAAVFTTDATGRLTLFNDSAVKLWGHSPDLHEDWLAGCRLFRPDGTPLPSELSPITRTLREGRSIRGEEIVIERSDGSRSHVLPHPELLRDLSGEIVGAVNMLVDLTQMKQMEEQFRQAQKMEAIGRLAGGVAHDFNNLLTVINGYGGIVLKGFKANDPNFSHVTEIIRAGERAAGLTGQLLAFSRQQVVRPQVLNLNALVAASEKMLRRLLGEDLELKTIKDPALGNIKADPGQVEQVLLNLAVNARDAMPQGGKVCLTTRNVDLDAEQLLGHPDNLPGPYVLLAISDNGCGMSKATLARIFEPFFTTKGAQGTGLGLATVFGIVKQSHGVIKVVSEPGRGATFNVYFPRAFEPIALTMSPSIVPAPLRGSETILLTEDEESVRSLARHILEEGGYTVLEASSGSEAMRICEKQGPTIDMLVTDVVMPRMSGLELVNQLAERWPEIKVLYMSGYTDDAVINYGIRHDATHFLQKPFDPEELALKVREVLNSV